MEESPQLTVSRGLVQGGVTGERAIAKAVYESPEHR